MNNLSQNVNLKDGTAKKVSEQVSATKYLLYIGLPVLVVVLVAASIGLYCKSKGKKVRPNEIDEINSKRNLVISDKKELVGEFPLEVEEVEMTGFREDLQSKYGVGINQIIPIKPFELAKETWDGGYTNGPTSIFESPYSTASKFT